ncbi:MAG: Gfo/Idh/MocA family protein [Planctomycetota bacterium]|jgi:predicted dehydrogenase
MGVHKVGVIMNGVSGRMGANQHLERSVMAIRNEGGVKLQSGPAIVPEPILVGRNAEKLRALAERFGGLRFTTDLDAALSDPAYSVYFDSLATHVRVENVLKAIAAGKHVYTEKPTATTVDDALALYHESEAAGIKHGVVQDKLWLPGLLKLKHLIDNAFFGRILSVRGEFGYFVFDGIGRPAQRPSWNYRREAGGGIIFDMFAHWRYVIDNLFGPIKELVTLGATHIDHRADEEGEPYHSDADDAAYAIFVLDDGTPVQFNSSWCTRVRRDDLLTVQVDGTEGSAVAGLRDCWTQTGTSTPNVVWNPDVDQPTAFHVEWEKLPLDVGYDNAFKAQWELFLKHVVAGAPFRWGLLEGAKGVQLADLAMQSWQKRAWVGVPSLA